MRPFFYSAIRFRKPWVKPHLLGLLSCLPDFCGSRVIGRYGKPNPIPGEDRSIAEVSGSNKMKIFNRGMDVVIDGVDTVDAHIRIGSRGRFDLHSTIFMGGFPFRIKSSLTDRMLEK